MTKARPPIEDINHYMYHSDSSEEQWFKNQIQWEAECDHILKKISKQNKGTKWVIYAEWLNMLGAKDRSYMTTALERTSRKEL